MYKKIIFILLGIISFLICDENNIITIIGTTNVHGEIDPCGWKKKPLGGLARKATILENLIDNNESPIILDAGDLYYKKEEVDPGVSLETAMINAEIITDSFNAMGCDAFSPGSKDFAGGIDFLLKQYENADFPYVSCNISNTNSELLFKPYIIKEHKDFNIGIIGVASVFESDGIIVKDPFLSLDLIIEEVENKSDLIILLFNATQQDLTKLYNKGYNIDMILSSKGRTRSSDGGSKIPTYIAGDRGKILYKFEFNLRDKGLPVVDIAWCKNTINRVTDRLDKMRQGDDNANLYLIYKDDQKTLNRIYAYESQIEKANQLLENAVNILEFEKIELGQTVFDRPDILKIVDKGKLKIKDIVGPLLPPEPENHKHRHPHDHDGDGYPDH